MSNLWTNVEDLGDYADSEYAYDAVKTASQLLWSMSGRKYSGTTTVTERYVSSYDPFLRLGASSTTHIPTLINGNVENLRTGGIGINSDSYLGDGSSANRTVRLRGRKVIKIHNVRDIAGEIIDPTQYYLVEHSTIVGTPGSTWTSANVEVTYTYGTPPPTAGQNAARILATELVKLYTGDDTCALPQRVTSVARQGVSYTILDTQDFIDELRTGLYAVDLFLKSTNPDKARARSRVFSPDVPKARRINPKPYIYTETASDIKVLTSGGSVVLYLDEISAEFLKDDAAWDVYITVSNYTDSTTTTLSTAAVLNRSDRTLDITNSYRTGTTVTLTTSAAHGLSVGSLVAIDGTNGNPSTEGNAYVVTVVPTSTTFKYTTAASGTITSAADTGVVTIVGGSAETITINVTYSEILAILGAREPGVYDVYCTRPSLGDPAVDEVINLLTANISLQLASNVSTIYTL